MSRENLQHLAYVYVTDEATDAEMEQIESLLLERGQDATAFALACQIELELQRAFGDEAQAARDRTSSGTSARGIAGASLAEESGANETVASDAVTRRTWLQAATAVGTRYWKSAAATVLGGAAGAAATRNVDAREVRALRAEITTLTEFQAAVRKYLDAFRLAHDQTNELGPAATISGFHSAQVSGVFDPDLIRRVEVSWGGQDENFEIVRPRESDQGGAIAAFSVRHRYLVEDGAAYRVVVRAIPRDEHRAALAEIGKDERWLRRESRFVGTPGGLTPAGDGPIQLNVPHDAEVTQDWLELFGTSADPGSVLVSFRSADGKLTRLTGPIDVAARRPWSAAGVDWGRFSNGPGTLLAAWLPTPANAWPKLNDAGDAEVFEGRGPAKLPDRLRVVRIPVRLNLAPPEFRAARWTLEQGGFVGLHGGGEARDLKALTDRQLSVQNVFLRNVPITDVRALRYCRELQGLHLPNTQVDDGALVDLAVRHPRLAWLLLGGTRVTDDGVVRELTRLSNLTMLDLNQNSRITNRSVGAIVQHLRHLTLLDLSSTGITSLAGLAELPELKNLRLANTNVSDQQVADLKGARPDLEISR